MPCPVWKVMPETLIGLSRTFFRYQKKLGNILEKTTKNACNQRGEWPAGQEKEGLLRQENCQTGTI
jgi:hypothetical protein